MKRQLQALKRIRETYFPVHVFRQCIVYRGHLNTMPQIMVATGQQAAVAMWKKGRLKRIHAAALQNLAKVTASMPAHDPPRSIERPEASELAVRCLGGIRSAHRL